MNDKNKKNIDDIVASYASIGREQKRRKLGLTIGGVAAVPLIALAVMQIANYSGAPDNTRAQAGARRTSHPPPLRPES